MGRKLIIAVDFDGTLHFGKYPYIGKPNEELIQFIKRNRNKYVWILWTCREGEQLNYAKQWLAKQDISFNYYNENAKVMRELYGNNCRKIFADIYLDDSAMDWREFINGKTKAD